MNTRGGGNSSPILLVTGPVEQITKRVIHITRDDNGIREGWSYLPSANLQEESIPVGTRVRLYLTKLGSPFWRAMKCEIVPD